MKPPLPSHEEGHSWVAINTVLSLQTSNSSSGCQGNSSSYCRASLSPKAGLGRWMNHFLFISDRESCKLRAYKRCSALCRRPRHGENMQKCRNSGNCLAFVWNTHLDPSRNTSRFSLSFRVDSTGKMEVGGVSSQTESLDHIPQVPLGGSRCPRLLKTALCG